MAGDVYHREQEVSQGLRWDTLVVVVVVQALADLWRRLAGNPGPHGIDVQVQLEID